MIRLDAKPADVQEKKEGKHSTVVRRAILE